MISPIIAFIFAAFVFSLVLWTGAGRQLRMACFGNLLFVWRCPDEWGVNRAPCISFPQSYVVQFVKLDRLLLGYGHTRKHAVRVDCKWLSIPVRCASEVHAC